MTALKEHRRGWTIRVPELIVTRCFVDWGAFGLVAYGKNGETSVEIHMSGPITWVTAGVPEQSFDADHVQTLAPLFGLLNQHIEDIYVARTGTLKLSFDDRSVLRCDPAEDYEAWEMFGPDPLRIVCPTGGEEPLIFGLTPFEPVPMGRVVRVLEGPDGKIAVIDIDGGERKVAVPDTTEVATGMQVGVVEFAGWSASIYLWSDSISVSSWDD